jgi:hypothetical protein
MCYSTTITTRSITARIQQIVNNQQNNQTNQDRENNQQTNQPENTTQTNQPEQNQEAAGQQLDDANTNELEI